MRRGSQEPTFQIAPTPEAGWDHHDGDDAVEFAARYGLTLDPWQGALVRLWMRRDSHGKWCAGTWGITVPRQNGKNGALEAVELFGMVVLRLKFLHTAHEVKTARKHFRRMKHFFGDKANDPHARFPDLNRLVKEVRNTNGQEAIFLWNPDTGEDLGSVEVVARSSGSARGFTNDVLVLDEAQHLTDDQLEASRPAISAAPSGDPVAIYMGTPPKDGGDDEGAVGAAFVRIRNSVRLGTAPRAAWMEFGIEADLDGMTDDEIRQLAMDMGKVARVNPALGIRLFDTTLVDELQELGPRSFCRERLNVWPVPRKAGDGVIPLEDWRVVTIEVAEVDPDWRLAAVGMDMDMTGRLWVAPAAFGPRPRIHVELWPDDLLAEGEAAAVDRIFRAVRKRLPVVMPGDSGAAVLEGPLRAKGAKVYRLNTNELAQAAHGLTLALRDKSITHLDDAVLDQGVRESTRVPMPGGRWRLGRGGELSGAPLLAVAGARYGAARWATRPNDDTTRTPGRTGGGRTQRREVVGSGTVRN